MSFYRIEKGFEVDLMFSQGARVRPVEVKSARTFSKDLVGNLSVYSQNDPAAADPLLVYDGERIEAWGRI